ncbi:MAG: aldolase/citrate lyase family protein [Thermoplasmatales archaeon]|jgi:2-dehydro-3-deoxyglucarate aldolase/4-hydroxy-2-oxoheptanedioate aldolase|nr:aldolase/citrate lyase family protein [Candidatus Thermoplasmatota archaeon]MDA8055873.1 aldolase/citrate lyase family protein [Thermoplasmatales archaeon]
MREQSDFLKKLKGSRSLLAPLISIRDSSVSEMISLIGPDFLIVDMEHSAIDIAELQNILIAAKPMDVVARIRGLEKNEIKKVLDTGVAGIIIPGIETPEETMDAVSYSRIPPDGIRGIGPGRGSKYGYGFAAYVKEANKQAVIVQIETKKAFENLKDILSVPGLDGCFVGPVDLTAALGIEFSWSSKIFVSAIDKILSESRARDLVIGIYTPLANRTPEPIISRGFNFIMYGTDREAVQLEYRNSLETFRNKTKTLTLGTDLMRQIRDQ